MLQRYARHFPLDKGKRRVINQAIRVLPVKSGPKMTTLIFNHLKVRCDLSKFMQRELFFFGAYEAEDCRMWISLVPDADIIFDVGANIGLYSLLAASTNARSVVHAFEPTPSLSQAIDENLRLNNLNNVVNNRLAVGDTIGDVFLNFSSGTGGNNEGMNFVTKGKVEASGEATTATTLDQYCQDKGITSIDLMKMDVEGGEYAVLMGAKELLKNQAIKCIVLELIEWAAKRSGHSTRDVKQILVDNGYQIYALHDGKKTPLSVEGTDYSGNILAEATRLKH